MLWSVNGRIEGCMRIGMKSLNRSWKWARKHQQWKCHKKVLRSFKSPGIFYFSCDCTQCRHWTCSSSTTRKVWMKSNVFTKFWSSQIFCENKKENKKIMILWHKSFLHVVTTGWRVSLSNCTHAPQPHSSLQSACVISFFTMTHASLLRSTGLLCLLLVSVTCQTGTQHNAAWYYRQFPPHKRTRPHGLHTHLHTFVQRARNLHLIDIDLHIQDKQVLVHRPLPTQQQRVSVVIVLSRSSSFSVLSCTFFELVFFCWFFYHVIFFQSLTLPLHHSSWAVRRPVWRLDGRLPVTVGARLRNTIFIWARITSTQVTAPWTTTVPVNSACHF